MCLRRERRVHTLYSNGLRAYQLNVFYLVINVLLITSVLIIMTVRRRDNTGRGYAIDIRSQRIVGGQRNAEERSEKRGSKRDQRPRDERRSRNQGRKTVLHEHVQSERIAARNVVVTGRVPTTRHTWHAVPVPLLHTTACTQGVYVLRLACLRIMTSGRVFCKPASRQ